MRISEVTNEDGKQCAQLINALRTGRWDISGADAEVLVSVKKWVQQLAGQMAAQLGSKSTPSSAPMKVKSMGTSSVAPTIKKSKKK